MKTFFSPQERFTLKSPRLVAGDLDGPKAQPVIGDGEGRSVELRERSNPERPKPEKNDLKKKFNVKTSLHLPFLHAFLHYEELILFLASKVSSLVKKSGQRLH